MCLNPHKIRLRSHMHMVQLSLQATHEAYHNRTHQSTRTNSERHGRSSSTRHASYQFATRSIGMEHLLPLFDSTPSQLSPVYRLADPSLKISTKQNNGRCDASQCKTLLTANPEPPTHMQH